MGNVSFTDRGLEDYMYWQAGQDKKTLKRLNALILDMKRSPFDGIGKPEPLKGDLGGCWAASTKKTESSTMRKTEPSSLSPAAGIIKNFMILFPPSGREQYL